MIDNYKTIAKLCRAELKISRSRFIATAIPVVTQEEAEKEYNLLSKQFHDATHNCFAYVVGVGQEQKFRYSDDGEPNGTAGKPIYDAIIGSELTNVLINVTRYYGGIKLGTGGLSRAYRDTAKEVVAVSEIIKRYLKLDFEIHFEHSLVNLVMRILAEFNITPINTNYDDNVEIIAKIRLNDFDRIKSALINRSHGKINIEEV